MEDVSAIDLKYSRVFSKFNLAAVPQLAKPPELMVRVRGLGIAEEIILREGEGFIRIIQRRIEVANLASSNPRCSGPNISILTWNGRILPVAFVPPGFEYLFLKVSMKSFLYMGSSGLFL